MPDPGARAGARGPGHCMSQRETLHVSTSVLILSDSVSEPIQSGAGGSLDRLAAMLLTSRDRAPGDSRTSRENSFKYIGQIHEFKDDMSP